MCKRRDRYAPTRFPRLCTGHHALQAILLKVLLFRPGEICDIWKYSKACTLSVVKRISRLHRCDGRNCNGNSVICEQQSPGEMSTIAAQHHHILKKEHRTMCVAFENQGCFIKERECTDDVSPTGRRRRRVQVDTSRNRSPRDCRFLPRLQQ